MSLLPDNAKAINSYSYIMQKNNHLFWQCNIIYTRTSFNNPNFSPLLSMKVLYEQLGVTLSMHYCKSRTLWHKVCEITFIKKKSVRDYNNENPIKYVYQIVKPA